MILYGLFLLVLSIYSYSLIDLNLTLINHPLWNKFRDMIIQLGYFHRDVSWNVYLILLVLAFLFHYFFIKNYKKYNPFTLSIIIGGILLFAYPFLSHDLFNYLFDAKIFTFYHQNPYLKEALNFPSDPWIRFMHWTNRTYPYGPSFLLLTLIPSFLSFGKFLLSFLFYKMLVVLIFIWATASLNKVNKMWAMIFATNPLVIFEGIINGHNDMIAMSLALIAIIYLSKNKNIFAKILLLLSGGIKYVTFPLLFLTKKSWLNNLILLIEMGILVYMGVKMEIQPWYYLTLLVLLPFNETILLDLNIFIFGLLVAYYPYIRMGGWDTTQKVLLKHEIITVFFFLNLFYFFTKKIIFQKMKFGSQWRIFKSKS